MKIYGEGFCEVYLKASEIIMKERGMAGRPESRLPRAFSEEVVKGVGETGSWVVDDKCDIWLRRLKSAIILSQFRFNHSETFRIHHPET